MYYSMKMPLIVHGSFTDTCAIMMERHSKSYLIIVIVVHILATFKHFF